MSPSSNYSPATLAYFATHAIDPVVAEVAGVTDRPEGIVYPYVDDEGGFERIRPLNGATAKTRQPHGRSLCCWWPAGHPQHAERVLVCEGESDALAALSALQADTSHAVAAEILDGLSIVAVPGASFPADRLVAGLLQAKTRLVFVASDGDEAGERFADRATDSLQRKGIQCVRLPLPGGTDLADCLAAADSSADWLAHAVADAEGIANDPGEPCDVSPEPGAKQLGQSHRQVILTPASAFKPEAVRWAWENRFPLGAVSILAGEPGLGKSTTTIHVGARISTGTLEGALYGQPADVLYVTLEDHIAGVVRPRLEAAGADLDRVHLLEVKVGDNAELITIPDDLPGIEQECAGRDVRLLVVDPVVATLADSIDSHKDQSVRRALAPLALFAERLNLAAVAVMHLSKQQATSLLNRVSGSVGFGGAARSVLIFARDPEDPDGEEGYERVLVHAKSNWGQYAPALACRVEGATIETDEGPSSHARLAILGESATTASDLSGGHDAGELEDAVEFLTERLADGEPHPAREVKDAAGQRRISVRTLHRARSRLGVVSERSGFPAVSTWCLPVVPAPVVPTPGTTSWHNCKNGSTEPNIRAADPSCANAASRGTTGAIQAAESTSEADSLVADLAAKRINETEFLQQISAMPEAEADAAYAKALTVLEGA